MSSKKKGGFRDFLREARKEMFERSTWPSREEVLRQTIVVVIALAVFAVVLGVVDAAALSLVEKLLDADSLIGFLTSRVTIVVGAVILGLVAFYFLLRALRSKR